MLVLTRRVGEKIIIRNDIVVEVDAMNYNSVKLRITTPEGVIVTKAENLLPKDKCDLCHKPSTEDCKVTPEYTICNHCLRKVGARA